ncbi:chaperone protein dnaJ 16-like [Malus sylvestris]|uniref:chaperone protein dnaJ 16-like n=1 Tax=Malus sylvestris TaxID=3752 RepID=UPI0021AC5DE6|nr:chaperone protein dnaJ 16-like [Malus sylvestris]
MESATDKANANKDHRTATVLEEALNGVVTTRPLPLGQKKVEKQCDHFYSFTITEAEARGEFVCQGQSLAKASSSYNTLIRKRLVD